MRTQGSPGRARSGARSVDMMADPPNAGRVVDHESIAVHSMAVSIQRSTNSSARRSPSNRWERLERAISLRQRLRTVRVKQLQQPAGQLAVVRRPGGEPIERDLLDPDLTGLAAARLETPWPGDEVLLRVVDHAIGRPGKVDRQLLGPRSIGGWLDRDLHEPAGCADGAGGGIGYVLVLHPVRAVDLGGHAGTIGEKELAISCEAAVRGWAVIGILEEFVEMRGLGLLLRNDLEVVAHRDGVLHGLQRAGEVRRRIMRPTGA